MDSAAKIIDHCVEELEPVKPLEPTSIRLSIWLAVAIIALTCGALVLGIRPDMAEGLPGQFFFETTILILASITVVYLAVKLSVPGDIPVYFGLAGLLWYLSWIGILGIDMLHSHQHGEELHLMTMWTCPLYTTLLGILPAVGLFFIARQGVSISYLWSGFLIGLCIGITGALGMQFVCPAVGYHPLHTLVFHASPALVLSLAGYTLGAKLFRW